MFEWTYRGVDSSVPGNGGPECAGFLSLTRRAIETFIVFTFAALMIRTAYVHLSLPSHTTYTRRENSGKRYLLVVVSLILGMEIGFKLASETLIYLLNPCHVTTALQIFLLAAPPSKLVTCIFRIHLNFLNGAVLAFLFPVTESRMLPFETSIYWIQHSMLMVVPYFLLRLGGVYNVEKLSDFSWCALSYGLNMAYHFGILQTIAIPSQVNLNHMLCPTTLDPFYSPYYRLCAVTHQAILCPLTCKVYCYLSDFLLTKFGPTKVKHNLDEDIMLLDPDDNSQQTFIHQQVTREDTNTIKNGRLHLN